MISVKPVSNGCHFAAAIGLGFLLLWAPPAVHAANKVTLCYGAVVSALVPIAKQQNFFAAEGIEADLAQRVHSRTRELEATKLFGVFQRLHRQAFMKAVTEMGLYWMLLNKLPGDTK